MNHPKHHEKRSDPDDDNNNEGQSKTAAESNKPNPKAPNPPTTQADRDATDKQGGPDGSPED